MNRKKRKRALTKAMNENPIMLKRPNAEAKE